MNIIAINKNKLMGIKHLNKYLYEKCGNKSITNMHLRNLSGKTLVIDTSIYLYQFLGENALLENMYLFISIMLLYEIRPIFIFDGKPPPEKHDLLRKRSSDKRDARSKYNELEKLLKNATKEEKKKILYEMNQLKRQFIRITDEHIANVKQLMDAFNVTYYNSPNEADELCVYLVKSGKAWGCVSDDMDMFVYGCPFVLRNLSLLKHTITVYDTSKILSELDLSEKQFCEIMTISGTDYNIHSATSLSETLQLHKEYTIYNKQSNDKPHEFYIWLLKNTKYINNYRELMEIFKIFQCCNFNTYDNIDLNTIPINNKPNTDMIHKIMKKEGFVFI